MYNPIPDLISVIVGLISIAGAMFLVRETKAKIPHGQTSQEPLTKNEKIKVWILAILNPVLTGAILYFGWRKSLPIKAKNANVISFAALGLWIVLSILLGWPLNFTS
jgi:hypothetical protein